MTTKPFPLGRRFAVAAAFLMAAGGCGADSRSQVLPPTPAQPPLPLPTLEERLRAECAANKAGLLADVRELLSAGRHGDGLTRLQPCLEVLEDPELAEMHRRLRVASLRAALRQEPPGNVKRREQMIRELAQVDPHWRKWHGKEMTTIEAREREAQRRREAREARAKARQASAPRAPAPAADLATRNQQKLDEYAMLLGRGMACGLDTRREGKLVAAWIDRAFPLMTKSRFLEGFAATMEHHAQQQAQGKSTASCKSVQQTLAAMSDEDWSGPP